jgi:hypothetical protein
VCISTGKIVKGVWLAIFILLTDDVVSTATTGHYDGKTPYSRSEQWLDPRFHRGALIVQTVLSPQSNNVFQEESHEKGNPIFFERRPSQRRARLAAISDAGFDRVSKGSGEAEAEQEFGRKIAVALVRLHLSALNSSSQFIRCSTDATCQSGGIGRRAGLKIQCP